MTQRRSIFLVPGIRTMPGDSKNWSGRGVTWLHTHCHDCVAEKVEYLSLAITRPFGQRNRRDKLIRTASFYDPAIWRRDGAFHSNGNTVLCDALEQNSSLRFHTVHLVNAACEADFWKNGLNSALREGRIQYVRVYVATKDVVLQLASLWFSRTILGYGTLGLKGPKNVAEEVAGRVSTIRWKGFGHSTCWDDRNFDDTMRLLFT